MSTFLKTISYVAVFSALLTCLPACKDKAKEGQKDKKETAAQGKTSDLPDGLTPEVAAKVVAKIGDKTITVGDVTRQINRLSPYIRRRWAAPDKRKEFLEKLIRAEILSKEAERLGFSEDPEVQRTAKQVMVRLMIKNDLEKNLFPNQIDEATLKAEYEKEKNKYSRPAQIRASQIVLANKAEAEKLLAELKSKAADSQLFRDKAKELSIDAKTKDNGGDLGYFSKSDQRLADEPEVPVAVAEAAWKIENNGDLSNEAVKTKQGYHIIKLTNKRQEMNRTFESVKRMIENRLLREKRTEAMDNFVKGLREKADIKMFDENIAKLDFGSDEIPDLPNQVNKQMKLISQKPKVVE